MLIACGKGRGFNKSYEISVFNGFCLYIYCFRVPKTLKYTDKKFKNSKFVCTLTVFEGLNSPNVQTKRR